jgi:hypothetical protein
MKESEQDVPECGKNDKNYISDGNKELVLNLNGNNL